jgi:hypothetical protein
MFLGIFWKYGVFKFHESYLELPVFENMSTLLAHIASSQDHKKWRFFFIFGRTKKMDTKSWSRSAPIFQSWNVLLEGSVATRDAASVDVTARFDFFVRKYRTMAAHQRYWRNGSRAGLPDGTFAYQNSQFGPVFKGLGLENFGTFWCHSVFSRSLVNFCVHLVYFGAHSFPDWYGVPRKIWQRWSRDRIPSWYRVAAF